MLNVTIENANLCAIHIPIMPSFNFFFISPYKITLLITTPTAKKKKKVLEISLNFKRDRTCKVNSLFLLRFMHRFSKSHHMRRRVSDQHRHHHYHHISRSSDEISSALNCYRFIRNHCTALNRQDHQDRFRPPQLPKSCRQSVFSTLRLALNGLQKNNNNEEKDHRENAQIKANYT